MALTALDPMTALVIVDLQRGLVGSSFAAPIDGVVERSRALADAFRARELPVVLVNVDGGAPGRTEQPRRPMDNLADDFTQIIPELDQQPNDLVVTKRTWGAFASTDLEARLKAAGVTQVVITGVATGTGVESTARQAYELGFNVTLTIDAMADTRPEAHDHAIKNVFPRLGETGLTADVLALLER
jgi:nicotinamidase-related amidase